MALFKRADLKAKGLADEQIEYLMTESNRALAADYAPKSDIDNIVAEKTKGAAKKVEDYDEYKALQAKYSKLEAFSGDEFAAVKKPYRDVVWGQLDHADKHKEYAEQLKDLKTKMPDLFASEEKAPDKPVFGAPTQGKMPTGENGKSFMDSWGFIPKK